MLLTKLYKPKIKSQVVYRQEIATKLDKANDKKLVLVSAPAGYGKSTLISQWIDKSKCSATWYALDDSDNDPTTFLKYLITSLQTFNKDFGLGSLDLLNSPNKASLESIASLLINDLLSLQDDIYVVLDDFHFISNEEVFTTLRFILLNIPDHIHFIIITRSDPPLITSRLRSQNQLLELRINDLSFKASEIASFFNKKLKLGLNNDDIYALESKTEGWAVGLQLAALSIQETSDKSAFIKELAGSNRYIMDYLIEEVMRNQSIEVQDFLLKTSFLKQISAPLCNAILNRTDSQLILEQLERDNLFVVPLDTHRKWFRYHHLFADLLKQRFLLEDKTLYEDLNKKAAQWFELNEIHEFAIEHSFAINDYEQAVEIIGKTIETMWHEGKHAAILNYGKVLPNALIKRNSEFCLYYAWTLIADGKVKKATPFLESAEQMAKDMVYITTLPNAEPLVIKDDIQYYKNLYGKIAIAFAYLYSHENHSDKILEYCNIALENLSEDDLLWQSWLWFTYGLAYFSEGNLEESRKAFDKAYNYAYRTGNVYLLSTILTRFAETEQQLGLSQSAYDRCVSLFAYINELGYTEVTKTDWTYAPLYLTMGVSELDWAEFDKAYDHLKIAYNLSKKGNDNFFKVYVTIIYAVVLNYQGDKEGETIARELDEEIKETVVPPFLFSFYITSKIYWLMKKNQIEQAYNFAAGYGIGLNNKISHAFEMAYVAFARLLIHESKLNEAETLLSDLHLFATANNESDRIIEVNIVFAELFELQGQRTKAVECLMQALEMSAAGNQLFSFVFSANKLKNVLEAAYKLHATTNTKIPDKFIKKLQQTIKREENGKQKKSESDLSERELETLVLLAEDISNQEIADKLFISLNTVKTRLKSIFLKLNVDNRRTAFKKAKEEGLI